MLVTGARHGNGTKIAEESAANGAFVIVNDLEKDSAGSMVADAVAERGTIDILVNNTGVGQTGFSSLESDDLVEPNLDAYLWGSVIVPRQLSTA